MMRRCTRISFNRHPAQMLMRCGRSTFAQPTMGAWLTYRLGSTSQNLPGYVVLNAGRDIKLTDVAGNVVPGLIA